MPGRLAGEVALITGGASGIGRAAASLFHAEGARVVIADADDAAGAAAAAALAPDGEVRFCRADVTRAAEAAAAVRLAREQFGSLSILVNAVGASGRRLGDGPVDTCAEAAWEFVLATNLKSVYLCSQAAIPALRERGGGAIVNVASVLGLVGHPLFSTHAYAASKGGIIALTRAMAVTYAPERIRVNVLCPGLIDTPMSARAAQDPTIQAALASLQPLTGAMGTAEEVARAIAFLASDEASFITGAVLPVDGGWTAG